MKTNRILALLLAIALVATLFVGCAGKPAAMSPCRYPESIWWR